MNKIDTRLLREIADLEGTPKGAYNIRKNGQLESRSNTANIEIVSKTDKSGIDIHIKAGTKNQSVHIPVIITETGLDELVYNDFYIGPDCDVVIVAGCGNPQRRRQNLPARRGAHLLRGGELQGAVRGEALRRGRGNRRADHEPPDSGLPGERGLHPAGHHPAAGGGLHQTLQPKWW